MTVSSRFLTSGKKLIRDDRSPSNNKSQGENFDRYVSGIKGKLIKTISNQQIVHKKLSTKKVKKPKCDDSDFNIAQNLSYGVQNESVESVSSLSDCENDKFSNCRSTTHKKTMKIVKRANEELYMAAEKGSLAIVQHLLFDQTLSYAPDINFRGPDYKTPLYAASSEGHVEVVEYLISQNALVD